MGVEARPYVGTWRLNNQKVVRVTPDALVFLNGDLTIPGCPTCSGKIDIQKYITQVSIDPSTEGPATASISLHVPRSVGDGLVRDGNFVIQPGLEVHIYLRGYFPTRGLTAGVTPEQSGGVDVQNAVMYPYYLVHHGVITDVNYEYSGGEHTASLSCADLLHFWQYQRMSTNGALFGARPTNSKVDTSLVGHNMTGMSPYAIIYQLFRDVQGAAGGVEFALENKTNAAANSTASGESLFSLAGLYWQKRFAQAMSSLRMYGADGTLYNDLQAAYLARLGQADPASVSKKVGAKNAQSTEVNPMNDQPARILGFDPFSLSQGASGADNGEDGKLGINLAQIQAFVSDISQWGNVNFWESQYATKLEIANNVKEAAGFEFYQDVDGDIVFKPPFYNLDTSGSRVYRIEDIDIITFAAASKEPEATVVKVTGGHFRNTTGTGLENSEWGTRAEFIDYRLVAKFGWRQQTFETTYHTDSQAMFFACVARFDIFNIGMNSATASIPLRPELRPGYPVYIAPLDCYYYLHSFNHSFSFGSQCTTTLNLVGKRAKFFAPGTPTRDGTRATIHNIHLNNMQEPALPLQITEVDGQTLHPPRLQGFPNVVMTIDPNGINPLTFATGIDPSDLQSEAAIRNLVQQVLGGRLATLQQGVDEGTDEATRAMDGPWQIPTGNDTPPLIIPSITELMSQAQQLTAFNSDPNRRIDGDAYTRIQEATAPLQALLAASRTAMAKNFPAAETSARYLALLSDTKATYSPGVNLPGYYRYYSSSHPDPVMQGPAEWSVSTSGMVEVGTQTKPDPSKDQVAVQFATTASGGTSFVMGGEVKAGIPILRPGTTDQTVSTPTHQITTFQVARFPVTVEGTKSVETGKLPSGYPTSALASAYTAFFLPRMQAVPVGATSIVGEAFLAVYNLVATSLVEAQIGVYPEFPSGTRTFSLVRGIDTPTKLATLAREMAEACANAVSSTLTATYKAVVPVTGTTTSSFGTRKRPTAGASTEHQGEDIAAPVGTPIYAVLPGTVQFAGPRGGYGNLLILRHADGTTTRYAHCNTILVSVGQFVTAGMEIATVGASGNVTGPHLHFEVRNASNTAVDPESYLASLGTSVDAASLDAIWASVWPEGAQVQSGLGRNPQGKAQPHVKYYDVPVLPVSDARGYEVIGTYRYGRGLTLESLESVAGFTANTDEDYDSIEAFLDTVEAGASEASLSVAIGNLSPALRAQLAARSMSETVSSIVLQLDNPGGSQYELRGMNFPADTREFTQKTTLTNAAYGLADLTLTANRRSTCSCKGAEADTLLVAYDSELFVGIDDVDTDDTANIQTWLSDQMTGLAVDWAAAQSAFRGTIQDVSATGLSGVVQATGQAVTDVRSALTSTSEQAAEAQAAVDASILLFNGGV